LRPISAAALEIAKSSSTSPVAIFATMMARPMASAGRFSPPGPLGIVGISELRVQICNPSFDAFHKLFSFALGKMGHLPSLNIVKRAAQPFAVSPKALGGVLCHA
jgi:hypothetical protein